MRFSKYRRGLKLRSRGIYLIPLEQIKCQYNPDHINAWINVCGDSMSIKSSPYWHYLSYRKFDKYRRLFKLYGRNETWITNNIMKFLQTLESIQEEGVKEMPVVLDKPVLKNAYNDGYEIWEGHRRLAICMYLGIKQKVEVCEIV